MWDGRRGSGSNNQIDVGAGLRHLGHDPVRQTQGGRPFPHPRVRICQQHRLHALFAGGEGN